jgi:hypothetical protein
MSSPAKLPLAADLDVIHHAYAFGMYKASALDAIREARYDGTPRSLETGRRLARRFGELARAEWEKLCAVTARPITAAGLV